MFNYTQSLLSTKGQRALAVLQSHSVNHTRAFCIAVGYTLSSKLVLPVQETEDIEGFFRVQHGIQVSKRVSDINELLPHSTKQSMADVQSLFANRYNAAYPKDIPVMLSATCPELAFFGINDYVSQETVDEIKKNAMPLMTMISNLVIILEDIAASKARYADSQPDVQQGAIS